MRLLPGAGWRGKWDTGSRRVEIFRCKISKFWGSEVLHAAGSVSISLKFTQREIIQCSHRWKCNLFDYINYSVYESITWSLCTQYIYTIFVSYTLVRLGKKKRIGGGGVLFSEWCSVQASRFIEDVFCIQISRNPAPAARKSAWRDERCRWRMMQPLTQGKGLHVYFKLQVLLYTLTKALGQRFGIFSFPSPRFIVSIKHCCPSNRVSASAILSESCLLWLVITL